MEFAASYKKRKWRDCWGESISRIKVPTLRKLWLCKTVIDIIKMDGQHKEIWYYSVWTHPTLQPLAVIGVETVSYMFWYDLWTLHLCSFWKLSILLGHSISEFIKQHPQTFDNKILWIPRKWKMYSFKIFFLICSYKWPNFISLLVYNSQTIALEISITQTDIYLFC